MNKIKKIQIKNKIYKVIEPMNDHARKICLNLSKLRKNKDYPRVIMIQLI